MFREPDAVEDVPLEGGSVRVVRWGTDPARPALLALHGFTGSALDFEALAWGLDHHRVVAVDLPGHGQTRAPQGGWTEASWERALCALIREHVDTPVDLLGYSLGARSALALALAAQELVRRVILVGGTAGIEDDARAARRDADEALAQRIEREGAETFVAWWMSQPIIATQDRAPAPLRRRQVARRTTLDAPGLAESLRQFGQGASSRRWDRLHELKAPALLVAGERDPRYVDMAMRVAERWKGARCCIVPDAGHAPHLEQPEAFAELVASWLRETDEVVR